MQFFPKILGGMANCVDPDQIAEQYDLGLHCLHMPFFQNLLYEIIGHLPKVYKNNHSVQSRSVVMCSRDFMNPLLS